MVVADLMQIMTPQHPRKWRGAAISHVYGRFVGQLFISVRREDTFLTSDGRRIKLFPGCWISRGRQTVNFRSLVVVDFRTDRLDTLAVPDEFNFKLIPTFFENRK
jgi:hypothetical protein